MSAPREVGAREPGGPRVPALVAVAHGSRDPRSAATVAALVDEVRRQAPGLDVRLGFLDLSAPRLDDVLAGVAADGVRAAVVVPLLLGDAFHARVDVPGEVARAAARHPGLALSTAAVLGPDARLEAAARDRLAAVADLADPGLGVVLAAIGSSRAAANAAVADVAARLLPGDPAAGAPPPASGAAGVRPAFATCAPRVPCAITALRAAGARRVAVVPWLLAPGLLPDRIAAEAAAVGAVTAAPLADHPAVAAVVLDRYAAVAGVRGHAGAAGEVRLARPA